MMHKSKGKGKMLAATVLAAAMAFTSLVPAYAYLPAYDDSPARAEADKVGLQAAEEGIVLLKNDNNLLPYLSGKKVNIFGATSINPFLDGGGSGAIRRSTLLIDFYQALDDSSILYNTELKDWYNNWYAIHRDEPAFRAAAAESDAGNVFGTAAPTRAEAPWHHLVDPDYVWRTISRTTFQNPGGGTTAVPVFNEDGTPVYESTYITLSNTQLNNGGIQKPAEGHPFLDNQWEKALRYTNETAIIMIGRSGSESSDLELQDAKLRPSEADLIRHARRDYQNVIVIFNTLSTMEMGWLEDTGSLVGTGGAVVGSPGGADSAKTQVDAALMIWGPGESGMPAVAGVLEGTVNPSGRLADTIVYNITDHPAMRNYGDMGYSQQTDGIAREPVFAYGFSNGQFTGQGLRETQINKMTSLASGITGEGNFNNADMTFLHYEEGIYMGYRYFETFDKANLVQYPFGYGLSYTSFSWEVASLDQDEDEVTAEVKVTNTGSVAGKDVVEVYFSAPYTASNIAEKVEKAKNVLGGFAKTKLLAPGESEVLTVKIDKYIMASYNMAQERYILDGGDYAINFMSSLNGKNIAGNLKAARNLAVDRKDFYADPVTGTAYRNLFGFAAIGSTGDGFTVLSRNDHDGTYPKAREEKWDPVTGGIYQLPADFAASANPFPVPVPVTDENRGEIFQFAADSSDSSIRLEDIYISALADYRSGKYATIEDAVWDNGKWDAFIGQMTADEALGFISDCGYRTIPLARLGVPATIDNDGPQQIKGSTRANSGGGSGDPAGLAYPINTMVCCTWNVDLARRLGECVGDDAAMVNAQAWYAPSINLHRTPLSGRNFEYFSEDGFLTGKIAAQIAAGAQSRGFVVLLKHFALNDCEMMREGICTYANEQTMRELYLRSFEIAVKEGGAKGIMTAFNRVGRVYAGASVAMCTDILRSEWGFKGYVITDWYGGRRNGWRNPILCVYAQNDGLLRGSGTAASDVTYMKRALVESSDIFSNPVVFSQLVKQSVRNICAFKMFTLAFPYPAFKSDEFEADMAVRGGETFTVPITAKGCVDLAGLAGEIAYDPALLTLVGVTGAQGFLLERDGGKFDAVAQNGVGRNGDVVVGYATFSANLDLKSDAFTYVDFPRAGIDAKNSLGAAIAANVPWVTLDVLASRSAGVSAYERTLYGDKAEFTFAADDMDAVNLVELTFTVDGSRLGTAGAALAGLNGFEAFQDVRWKDLGDNRWQGNAILGAYTGVTMSGSMDIGKLALNTLKLGDAELEITALRIYGIDIVDGAAQSKERATWINPAVATTKVYSVYDLNGDDEVGLADLSLAFYYYRATIGDEGWEDAKVADVNGDGVVDMLDLVEIYANFIG